ncbi:MAG: response regulator [Micavibrio sp.]|nr:response regulator [Micavibrio sp.]
MPNSFSNIKILIIESEDQIADLLEDVLAISETRQIYKARTPQHALVMYAAIKPDLILLDMHVKPEDGVELAQKIREKNNPFNTPIILMSNESLNEDVERMKSAGIDDLLVKPFSYDDLSARINYVMKKVKG